MKEVIALAKKRSDALHRYVRTHPIMGEVYELVDGSIGDYVRDHGLMYAAAVAFYALLSLIPLLVLFASFAGYALHIVGDGDPQELERLIAIGMNQVRVAIPYIDPTLENELRGMVQQRTGLGIVGIVSLLIAASQVFRALEFSFARIYSRAAREREVDPQPRNFVLSKILFGGFITAIVCLLIVLRLVLAGVRQVTQTLEIEWLAFLNSNLEQDSSLALALDIFVIVIGFAIVLRFFGGRRVDGRFALLGGVLFCAGFGVLEWAYNLYLLEYGKLGALYGPFSALMVVVLWIFFVATWMLIVGQLVKTLQRRVLFGPRYEKRWGKRTVKPRDEEDVSTSEES